MAARIVAGRACPRGVLLLLSCATSVVAALFGVARAQRRIEAAQLARELEVPTTVVTHWVHALAANGEFHGGRRGDTIFSEAALQATSGSCPVCGSALPAGVGLRRCAYCDTEIFGG